MASNSKHTEWILETIDHLRRRKARPDLERICHVVRRRFGLSAAETEAKLEKLVDSETVIKVDYKGSTSYRNAAKWRKNMLGCAVLNSTSVSMKIIEAILGISGAQISAIEANQTPSEGAEEPTLSFKEKVAQYATEVGVSLESLGAWLRERCEGFDGLKSPLTVILRREVDAGRVERLMSCNYVITRMQMELVDDNVIVTPLKAARKSDPKAGPKVGASSDKQLTLVARPCLSDESSSEPKPSSKVEPAAKAHPPAPVQPARRGRPPKNRPPFPNASGPPTAAPATSSTSKLKRALTEGHGHHGGPDKKSTKKGDIKRSGPPSSDQQACDICEQSGLLLHCKDCTVKVHPSCLDYFGQLAVRAYRDQWQCINCKTCCVCQDPGHPDQMLFCDGCDKGYHMSCHLPAISKKPSGTWECSDCQLENMALQREEFMVSVGSKRSMVNDSAPPTPAESPVPSLHMNGPFSTTPKHIGEGHYPDASHWTVEDVVKYITSAGFPEESKVFFEQEIDGVALLLLKRADVLKGLNLKLGPALKINRHIQGLQKAC